MTSLQSPSSLLSQLNTSLSCIHLTPLEYLFSLIQHSVAFTPRFRAWGRCGQLTGSGRGGGRGWIRDFFEWVTRRPGRHERPAPSRLTSHKKFNWRACHDEPRPCHPIQIATRRANPRCDSCIPQRALFHPTRVPLPSLDNTRRERDAPADQRASWDRRDRIGECAECSGLLSDQEPSLGRGRYGSTGEGHVELVDGGGGARLGGRMVCRCAHLWAPGDLDGTRRGWRSQLAMLTRSPGHVLLGPTSRLHYLCPG
jgi:hypothetical protein